MAVEGADILFVRDLDEHILVSPVSQESARRGYRPPDCSTVFEPSRLIAVEEGDYYDHSDLVGTRNEPIEAPGVSRIERRSVGTEGVVLDGLVSDREARTAALYADGEGAQPVVVPFWQRSDEPIRVILRIPRVEAESSEPLRIRGVVENPLDESSVEQQPVRLRPRARELGVGTRAVDLEIGPPDVDSSAQLGCSFTLARMRAIGLN
jgi:hypothetical protein